MAHHFHAASAVLWTVLAIVQSWTIHHDRISAPQDGMAIFLLFPLFLVAGVWVIHVEATTLATGLDSATGLSDSGNVELAQFGFFDPLANLGYALMFWGGLKYRYKVHLHARYMLGTIMFVIAPIVALAARICAQDPRHAILYPFALGNLTAIESPCFFTRRRRSTVGLSCSSPVSLQPRKSCSRRWGAYQPGHHVCQRLRYESAIPAHPNWNQYRDCLARLLSAHAAGSPAGVLAN